MSDQSRQHEEDLQNVRPLLKVMAGVIATVLIGSATIWLGFQVTRPVPEPRAMAAPAMPESAPQLQRNPQGDLKALETEQKRRLHSLGWVNREAGRVHIPIEQAMQRLAEQHAGEGQP
ncbi:hypothetical protein QQM79_00100 [Marinobacteraceae bacterium S3BR75-40.1]